MREQYSTDRKDLEKQVVIHTYRATGPGGQHRNVTDSGVRIVHRLSGITVTATESRSQHRNKDKAYERLIQRLKKMNHREKPRVPTRKSHNVRERILKEKDLLQKKKRLRKPPGPED
ncbi:MAG: peptide chain release factor-like protein [Nitrospira sp.]